MTAVLLDASALLAYLLGEPGADQVESALAEDAVCGAANWSEVVRWYLASGHDLRKAKALFLSDHGLSVAAVTAEDAEEAARLWQPTGNLSLADRLCLALGARLDCDILTADQEWREMPRVRMIR